jgi:hypothetical protein
VSGWVGGRPMLCMLSLPAGPAAKPPCCAWRACWAGSFGRYAHSDVMLGAQGPYALAVLLRGSVSSHKASDC